MGSRLLAPHTHAGFPTHLKSAHTPHRDTQNPTVTKEGLFTRGSGFIRTQSQDILRGAGRLAHRRAGRIDRATKLARATTPRGGCAHRSRALVYCLLLVIGTWRVCVCVCVRVCVCVCVCNCCCTTKDHAHK